jgi:hypothetical protein
MTIAYEKLDGRRFQKLKAQIDQDKPGEKKLQAHAAHEEYKLQNDQMR